MGEAISANPLNLLMWMWLVYVLLARASRGPQRKFAGASAGLLVAGMVTQQLAGESAALQRIGEWIGIAGLVLVATMVAVHLKWEKERLDRRRGR